MSPDFWKDKTVLVTGHTGFKGSWLALWLSKMGANVVGISKDIPTQPSLFELADTQSKLKKSIINLDVRDYNNLEKTVQEYQPEIVIHMAAQAIVRESYTNPVETYSTNVMGTVNLLEAIRKEGEKVRVILNVTSDKCYDQKPVNNTRKAHKETDPMGGFDPYSNSKGCSELVTASFRDSFFNSENFEQHHVALASVRAGNVIGGGDWGQNRLVPDIMRGFLQDSKIKIRNPNAVRPWQFVLDPLECYLRLAELLWQDGTKYSKGWNIGPTSKDGSDKQISPKPVNWIVNYLDELLGGKIKVEYETEISNLHEEDYLELDCANAKTELGWQSKLDLRESLEWTSEWYKAYDQKKDMSEFSSSQIERFMSL